MLIKKKKEEFLSNYEEKSKGCNLIVCMYYELVLFVLVSAAQIKNLGRRLDNLSKDASNELNKACGNELWKSIGFEAFDRLLDQERRSRANYYYGQWQTVREIQDSLF
tara:strand:- start:646 stop:969 length:324 start_codon:yes stop_codon:yes gene_type:complete